MNSKEKLPKGVKKRVVKKTTVVTTINPDGSESKETIVTTTTQEAENGSTKSSSSTNKKSSKKPKSNDKIKIVRPQAKISQPIEKNVDNNNNNSDDEDSNAPKCAGCQKVFKAKDGKTPVFFTALNQNWHRKCFRCTKCRKNLVKINFRHLGDNRPYCVDCSITAQVVNTQRKMHAAAATNNNKKRKIPPTAPPSPPQNVEIEIEKKVSKDIISNKKEEEVITSKNDTIVNDKSTQNSSSVETVEPVGKKCCIIL